jgi:hypothetical protein
VATVATVTTATPDQQNPPPGETVAAQVAPSGTYVYTIPPKVGGTNTVSVLLNRYAKDVNATDVAKNLRLAFFGTNLRVLKTSLNYNPLLYKKSSTANLPVKYVGSSVNQSPKQVEQNAYIVSSTSNPSKSMVALKFQLELTSEMLANPNALGILSIPYWTINIETQGGVQSRPTLNSITIEKENSSTQLSFITQCTTSSDPTNSYGPNVLMSSSDFDNVVWHIVHAELKPFANYVNKLDNGSYVLSVRVAFNLHFPNYGGDGKTIGFGWKRVGAQPVVTVWENTDGVFLQKNSSGWASLLTTNGVQTVANKTTWASSLWSSIDPSSLSITAQGAKLAGAGNSNWNEYNTAGGVQYVIAAGNFSGIDAVFTQKKEIDKNTATREYWTERVSLGYITGINADGTYTPTAKLIDMKNPKIPNLNSLYKAESAGEYRSVALFSRIIEDAEQFPKSAAFKLTSSHNGAYETSVLSGWTFAPKMPDPQNVLLGSSFLLKPAFDPRSTYTPDAIDPETGLPNSLTWLDANSSSSFSTKWSADAPRTLAEILAWFYNVDYWNGSITDSDNERVSISPSVKAILDLNPQLQGRVIFDNDTGQAANTTDIGPNTEYDPGTKIILPSVLPNNLHSPLSGANNTLVNTLMNNAKTKYLVPGKTL